MNLKRTVTNRPFFIFIPYNCKSADLRKLLLACLPSTPLYSAHRKSPLTAKTVSGDWRGEEDLNLRTGLTVTRFPIVRLKPLSHLRMRCLLNVASSYYNIKYRAKNQAFFKEKAIILYKFFLKC